MKAAWLLAVLVACGPSPKSPHLDGGHVDSALFDTAAAIDMSVPPDVGPYRHTIALDGVDDFTSGETFGTTSSPAYAARVTWDADTVFVGYSGPDLDPGATDTSAKWLFVYLDTDPGATTGATASALYNTQRATFPTGFGAELYARYKCDTTFQEIDGYAAATWTMAAPLTSARSGDFVELGIPRSLLGGATSVGLVTWMINEKPSFEGSYAGLYAANFTDGYAATLPLTHYLRVDFASMSSPNAGANQAP